MNVELTAEDRGALSWPAQAYVYGTWGYALARAREHVAERRQRVYLYRGILDGEPVWVAAWDPKPARGVVLLAIDPPGREPEPACIREGWRIDHLPDDGKGWGDADQGVAVERGES